MLTGCRAAQTSPLCTECLPWRGRRHQSFDHFRHAHRAHHLQQGIAKAAPSLGVAAGALREHFARTYTDCDGHRHIHGANFGVCARAYLRAGGFAPLACSEDVALVAALQASGARIAWSAAPRVTTSARRDAKARGGFGDTLLQVVGAMGVAEAIEGLVASTAPGQALGA